MCKVAEARRGSLPFEKACAPKREREREREREKESYGRERRDGRNSVKIIKYSIREQK